MSGDHGHSHFENLGQVATSRLALAVGLTAGFVVVEAIAGFYANSLALLTDAAHNVTDVIALALSWYAIRLAGRPAHAGKTFGYHRAGILVALLNSTTLVVIALAIFYESYRRIVTPPQVNENILIGVALAAFAVNAGTAWLVYQGSHHDLNMRSAFLHLAADAVSTLGAVLAGVVMKITGWHLLDPLVSILIAGLILWSAWHIVRETVEILLEGTPRQLDMESLVGDVLAIRGVEGVHDLHVWSITQNMRALSAHVRTEDMAISDAAAIQRQVNDMLFHKYNIAHATLQLECAGCEPDRLYCDLVEVNGRHSH